MFQPTSSQHSANEPQFSAKERAHADYSEEATVQPKPERLSASESGTLAAVMPENHGVPGSNPGPAT
jgi:hypothetical protein